MNAGYAMVVKIVNAEDARPQPAARTHLGEAVAQLAQEAGADRGGRGARAHRDQKRRRHQVAGGVHRERGAGARGRPPARRRGPARRSSSPPASARAVRWPTAGSAAQTVSGTSAVEAGMKIASPAPKTMPATASCQMRASPESTSTADTDPAASRSRSAVSTSRRRETRSAHTPATSRKADQADAPCRRARCRVAGVADVEHRERDRDRPDGIAEAREGPPGEQQREVALTERVEVAAPAHPATVEHHAEAVG